MGIGELDQLRQPLVPNDEANLNVLDRGFARALTGSFERDRAKSRRVTHQKWLRRAWKERLLESAASIFRSQI